MHVLQTKHILHISVFALFFILASGYVYSQTSSDDIVSTVNVSVCGNAIQEADEDCDTSDLGSSTCESVGFGPGTLSCNSACEFNTTACSPAPTATPTPIPTQTPTLVPTSIVSSAASTSSNNDESSNSVSVSTVSPLPTQGGNIIRVTPSLNPIPAVIRLFDLDNDGALTRNEIPNVVRRWFVVWRSYINNEEVLSNQVELNETEYSICDINDDNICNVVDISVLFYYVEL